MKKQIKKRLRKYSEYPPNVPRKLIKLYRSMKQNGLQLAKHLGVNDAHLSKLFNKGIEPKDEVIRGKLFLKKIKIKREKKERQPRPPDPEWMKEWKHLPTDERQRTIKEYLSWRKRNKANQ